MCLGRHLWLTDFRPCRDSTDSSDLRLGEHAANAACSADTACNSEGVTPGPASGSGVQRLLEADTAAARESLWRLLRVLVLQISEQAGPGAQGRTNATASGARGDGAGSEPGQGLACHAHRNLWETMLLALRRLAHQVRSWGMRCVGGCGA